MKALLGTVLVIGGSLIASSALAGGAERPKPKRGLVANAVFGGDKGTVDGLLYARQRGRQMGIIAILIGLKPGQRYALGFSRNGCGQGGGLSRKRIPFTGSAAGHAIIRARALPRLLRLAKSAVVLTPDGDDRLRRCGRLDRIVGDYDGDGVVEVRVAKQPRKRESVANAFLRPASGSALMEHEGIFYFARQPGRRSGIIAILIGLKPGQRYALGFSRTSCGQGGGLSRKRIPFTGSAAGHAVITDGTGNAAAHPATRSTDSPKAHAAAVDAADFLAWQRSVVVLTPQTGDEHQACGRLDWRVGGDSDDRPTEEVA